MVSLPPHQRLVDGLLLPVAVGGHPALDFCNTCAGFGEPGVKEYLESYDHLALFAREAGLLDAAACTKVRTSARSRPHEAAAVLAAALELRASFHRVCISADGGGDRAVVVARVEEAARAAVFELRAGRPNSAPAASWSLPAQLELPLLVVARSAGALLAAGAAQSIRSCPGRGCGWLFLDRTGRRRWCSMASCGNREKVRRHAVRARAARR